MIKKLTFFLMIFVIFITGCSVGDSSSNNKNPDVIESNLTERFLMVGDSGIVNRLTYESINDYSYQNLNMPYFKINASVVSESGLMVAVGNDGVILVTDDIVSYEKNWKIVPSNTMNNLNSITLSSSGQYLAVGDNGTILKSYDGLNWVIINKPGDLYRNYLKVVVNKNNLFVVLSMKTNSQAARVLSSYDLKNWNSYIVGDSDANIYDIALNNKESYLATSDNIIYSSRNLSNWFVESSIQGFHFTNIVAGGNGNFVSLTTQNKISYSSNNKWYLFNLNSDYIMNKIIAKDESTFLAVGNNGKIIKSKDGGFSWNYYTYPSVKVDINNIITDYFGKFVSITDNREVLKSIDGQDWELDKISNSATNQLRAVTKYKNKYMAIGISGTILSSLDTKTWIRESSTTTTNLNNFLIGGNNILAFGSNGNIISSLDGKKWVKESSGVVSDLNSGIVSISGKYFIVGNGGGIISSMDNGKTWKKESSFTNENLLTIAKKNNRLIIGGKNGIIYTSVDDGKTWESLISNVSSDVMKVINYKDKFLALTLAGLILTSVDGTNWNIENTKLDTNLVSIACNSYNICVAVGNSGNLFATDDLKKWNKLSNMNGYYLKDVIAY